MRIARNSLVSSILCFCHSFVWPGFHGQRSILSLTLAILSYIKTTRLQKNSFLMKYPVQWAYDRFHSIPEIPRAHAFKLWNSINVDREIWQISGSQFRMSSSWPLREMSSSSNVENTSSSASSHHNSSLSLGIKLVPELWDSKIANRWATHHNGWSNPVLHGDI